MKENNKGKIFFIIVLVLLILALQPGIRQVVIKFFTKVDIWSQLGFEKT